MQKLNYGIIEFFGIRREGYVDYWEVKDNGTISIEIEGVSYKTGVNNVLLMHKDQD